MNRPLLMVAYLSLFCFGFVDNLRGPFYPLILDHFKLSTHQGSWFWAWASVSAFLVNITSPLWLSQLSGLRWMAIGLVSLAFGPISLGLSLWFNSQSVLWVSTFFWGLGFALINQMVSLFIIKIGDSQKRRRLMGGAHATFGLSAMMAPLAINFWMKNQQPDNYRWFFFFAVIPLTVFLMTMFLKEGPRFQPVKRETAISVRVWIRWALLFGSYIALEVLVSSRLILYLKESVGLAAEESHFQLTLFFLMMLLGRLVLAFVSISIYGRSLLLLSVLGTLLFLYIGIFYLYHFLAVCGFSMAFFFPVVMDVMAEEYGSSSEQLVPLAFSGVDAFLVIFHLGFGQMVFRFGIDKAMYLNLALAVWVLILILFLPKAGQLQKGSEL
ncbi:MAG: MFS transporter [Bdellovibrionales bacterium]|nr:MFS transporter [Bdellovibrionales bacterium]